ncbi:hypothetical protein HYV80_05265 [Candidatus Woesearchaeota archaeon]|nr:hypothetical protein [Candidatus Woesearchaeota archaeon]
MASIKETFRKLEFGMLDLLVGTLMVVGLIGYFGSVNADLDWIDHTVSFILFSYLFYKMDITSILFGKTSKFANFTIIISYFSLFFKDVISYTKVDAFRFRAITFVNEFYLFFSNNAAVADLAAFYLGIAGICIAGIYITKKIEVSHPSLLYAVHQKKIKSNSIRFFSIFILLLAFYYFVYNMALEWLEFVIDDPVIAAGIIFFAYKITKHYQKFHPGNFVFRIGEFSTGMYKKFISMFHYKKTLPLAISGLLILHAMADLGVFAYTLIFSKENFYLELLDGEHAPFLKLFMEDTKNLPSASAVPLAIAYAFNAMSLAIFFIIPVAVWARMFCQKGLHLKREYLFFIYASAAAYTLLPGYVMKPLSQASITGVDITTISLLETHSFLENFFPDKPSIIAAVSAISILFGLAVYWLSSGQKIRRELYTLSIIGGLAFYAVYLWYFFSSLLAYFYDGISATIFTPHFLIGIIFAMLLALSAVFYVFGYLMFLYETVMEFHRQKWSEPIDNELVGIISKIKRLGRRQLRSRRAQIFGEVFKYALLGFASVAILISGYKLVGVVKERSCSTEIANFEIELRNLDKSLRFGAKELQTFDVPCKADKIYFFDLNRNINPDDFKDIPILADSVKSRSNNVFLVKDGKVKRSFYAGNLEMAYPYNICFAPKFDKISFFIESAGKSAKIASSCSQPECTFIPVEISEEDSRRIIREAIDFGCGNCPSDFEREVEKMRITRQNVEMFRKFTVCDGITTVEIAIKPKKGAEAKGFTFYEFLPKSCIGDLNSYLAENIEGNVDIKSDPLIMWRFDDLSGEKKFSYKLDAELIDECRLAIQGLGIAQFIEGVAAEEQDAIEQNTPPTINGLPDVSVAGIGLKKNVITNLWKYAQDKETSSQNLLYEIIDQTNKELVDCSVSNEKHIDCEVKQNLEGISRVTVQADDFELSGRASFNVEVTKFCKKHEKKGCVGSTIFWLDSCGNVEELAELCKSGEACEDGECEEICTPNAERKCSEDDKMYWVDSCGKKGQLYFDCKDNLARNQCRNGQCCIGNFFCEEP